MDTTEAFWVRARGRAKLANIPSILGDNPLSTLRPPVWSFGTTAEEADELAEHVVAGRKTATTSAHADYADQDEPLPEPGTLGIVADGSDTPRALIVTTEVRVVPFAEVDEKHARAEAAGSLQEWRETHERFFSEYSSTGFSADMEVVLEEFEVLYSE